MNERQSLKQFNAIIGLCVKVFVACAILMWSVFNLSLNILTFRASEEPDQAWLLTGGMVFLTCVIPFLLGLWLLFKSLGKPVAKSKA
jgi:hypothetical protein